MQKGDLVCYKGDRSALATIAMVKSFDYGAGKVITKAKIIYLTGPRVGTAQLLDARDLVKVENGD